MSVRFIILMQQNSILDSRITLYGGKLIRISTIVNKQQDQSDIFDTKPLNMKEKCCRAIVNYLTTFQQLVQFDNVCAQLIGLDLPQLQTAQQAQQITRLLNRKCILGQECEIVCATVSLSYKQVYVIAKFYKHQPNETFFVDKLYQQLINDMIAVILARHSIFTVSDSCTTCVGILGSIGVVSEQTLKVKAFQMQYQQNQIMSLIYFDDTSSQLNQNNNLDLQMIRISLLLTQNNASRIILYKGFPSSVILIPQIKKQYCKLFMQKLNQWNRCLGYLFIKSCASNCAGQFSSDDVPTLIQQANERSKSDNTNSKFIEASEITAMYLEQEKEVVQESQIDVQQFTEDFDAYILAMRDPSYVSDSSSDLQQFLGKFSKEIGFIQITPSSPQDLQEIFLRISNMRTNNCVKVVENILSQKGCFDIQIELATGYAKCYNTFASVQNIIQALNEAGFMCQIAEPNSLIENEQDESRQMHTETKLIWKFATAFVIYLIFLVLDLVLKTNGLINTLYLVAQLIFFIVNKDSVQLGICTSLKLKIIMPEAQDVLAATLSSIMNLVIIIIYWSTDNEQVLKLNKSNSTLLIFTLIPLFRLIEYLGKKQALKNFNGTENLIPQTSEVIKNIKIDKLVRQYNYEKTTVCYNDHQLSEKSIRQSEFFDMKKFLDDNRITDILDIITMKRSTLPDATELQKEQQTMPYQLHQIATSKLVPGLIVRVLRGEIIPCDGYIIYGSSQIDERILSKSKQGATKHIGDKVYAGTIPLQNDIFVCACKTGNYTLLGSIIDSAKRVTKRNNKLIYENEEENQHNNMTLVEQIMDKYRLIICSLGFTLSLIILILDLTVPSVYNYLQDVYQVNNIDYIVQIQFALEILECLLIGGSTFVYTVTKVIFSIEAAQLFKQNQMIVRNTLETCKKVCNCKVIAFPRTGSLSIGKIMITNIDMKISITSLLDYLISQSVINQSQDDQNIYILANGQQVEKENLLSEFQKQLEYYLDSDIVRQFLVDKAIRTLINAVGILVASNNVLAPGFINCIQTLRDRKFKKYIINFMEQTDVKYPQAQSYFFDTINETVKGSLTDFYGNERQDITMSLLRQFSVQNNQVIISITNLQDVPKCILKQNQELHGNQYSIIVNNQHLLNITVDDPIRPEAAEVIKYLQKDYKVYMTSTDTAFNCNDTAKKVGIPQQYVISNIPVYEKPNIIRNIQKEQGKMMYVCDGINDMNVVKFASVSAAISAGSEGIQNSTDIVSVNNNLEDLIKLIKLSRQIVTKQQIVAKIACFLSFLIIPFCAQVLIFAKIQFLPQYVCAYEFVISIFMTFISFKLLKDIKTNE